MAPITLVSRDDNTTRQLAIVAVCIFSSRVDRGVALIGRLSFVSRRRRQKSATPAAAAINVPATIPIDDN